MDWMKAVRAGEFVAIPADVDFPNSGALANLIDGYGLADEQRCSEIYFGVFQQCRRPGEVRASPLDLWIALFYAHDAYRQSGCLPKGHTAKLHDRLARELRAALLCLNSKQKAALIAAFADLEGVPVERRPV